MSHIPPPPHHQTPLHSPRHGSPRGYDYCYYYSAQLIYCYCYSYTRGTPPRILTRRPTAVLFSLLFNDYYYCTGGFYVRASLLLSVRPNLHGRTMDDNYIWDCLALLLSRTLGRAPPPTPPRHPSPPSHHTTNTLSLTLNTSRFILSSRFYHPFPVVSKTYLSAFDVICLS